MKLFDALLKGLVLVLKAGMVSAHLIQLLRQLEVVLVYTLKIALFVFKVLKLVFKRLNALLL